MGLLPEIEDGKIKELEKNSRPYTPPKKTYSPEWNTFEIGRDKRRTDAPTMQDMHECVPNEENECKTCHRDMLI